jgi:wobble nucleotide-excising tRNase
MYCQKIRTSELEAQNGSMKQTLKSIHHELGQNKEMVEELRRALETRDAEFKVSLEWWGPHPFKWGV